MTRKLPPLSPSDHGRVLLGTEPLVFHCNYYNYFLQKTLLLDESLGMGEVIRDAATEVAYHVLQHESLGETAADRHKAAVDVFAQLGFGLIDLSKTGPEGGTVHFPVSHYGRCMRLAVGEDIEFEQPQNHFDAGYAAGALAAIHGKPAGAYEATIVTCQSQADQGEIKLTLRETPKAIATPPGQGDHTSDPVPPPAASNIDEPAVLTALGGLDFDGNEEGLIPRFGVMLTFHFANFYNRISFEMHRKMAGSGLEEAAEMLLVDAGYNCAFHTFGGIMVSPEWDAVVLPQIKTRDDWVHGMVACVNALGWGVWRVHELTDDRLVVRIWDDYESTGYTGMYGKAESPISFLAQGGVAGLMNLVHQAGIEKKPALTPDFFAQVFEASGGFEPRQTKCQAMGDPYTEIVAERSQW